VEPGKEERKKNTTADWWHLLHHELLSYFQNLSEIYQFLLNMFLCMKLK